GLPGVARNIKNPNLMKTEFGWEIDPIGFRNTLREVYSRYRLPIVITENGLGAYDTLTEDGEVHDPYRITYLREHIKQMQLAITDDVEMMGYCPWSAIDLISTHEGMKKRYGFIYVDRDEFDLRTLDRYRKDSFYWYKKVIASNGEDLLPISHQRFFNSPFLNDTLPRSVQNRGKWDSVCGHEQEFGGPKEKVICYDYAKRGVL
ncbi:MAG: family 1 glycosylhydrolase, partial [Erysipelotrichaceae bacterium]|nr:family 1 glycosylhydrolase [Erysipelotrichaceae bacterium]